MKSEIKKALAIVGAFTVAACAGVFTVIKLKQRVAQCADRRALRKSQQGELDAIAMYDKLAEQIKIEKDAAVFCRLSADESGHVEVFRSFTNMTLEPKQGKATLIPLLYRIIGREKTYRIIARGEYNAAKKYERILSYPEVAGIQTDETRHGNTVLALIEEK